MSMAKALTQYMSLYLLSNRVWIFNKPHAWIFKISCADLHELEFRSREYEKMVEFSNEKGTCQKPRGIRNLMESLNSTREETSWLEKDLQFSELHHKDIYETSPLFLSRFLPTVSHNSKLFSKEQPMMSQKALRLLEMALVLITK